MKTKLISGRLCCRHSLHGANTASAASDDDLKVAADALVVRPVCFVATGGWDWPVRDKPADCGDFPEHQENRSRAGRPSGQGHLHSPVGRYGSPRRQLGFAL